MIQSITIQNFKSIADVTLPLGRINVLIGENGCGKSNLLEGIALGAAAAQGKLSNEFLAPRGIRVAPGRMTCGFKEAGRSDVRLAFEFPDDRTPASLVIRPVDGAWTARFYTGLAKVMSSKSNASASARRANVELPKEVGKAIEDLAAYLSRTEVQQLIFQVAFAARLGDQKNFLIYSPENSALRAFEREGQILPIGVSGEGLFSHLRQLWDEDKDLVLKISKHLELIDWFEGFAIPDDLGPGEHRLSIRDRFLGEGGILDQRSANEGFLFLLFYYTLFISPHTPSFFAIDNIDASLNPKLCQRLMRDLTTLAKEHDKQVIFTTHNPAILDGLDLKDDDQRLFVVSRQFEGPTKVHRVEAPKPLPGDSPVRLSEAFMQGYLGGLPKNF